MTASGAPRSACVVVLLFIGWPAIASPEEPEPKERAEIAAIDEDCLDCPVQLVHAWRFHAGDDPAWADPALDDSSWPLVDPDLSKPEQVPGGWQGIGWFRRRIRTTEAFGEVPLGVHILQAGASEIYLDGEQVMRFGTVSASADDEVPMVPQYVASVTLEPEVEHLLAVRYSNSTGNVLGRDLRGFRLTVGEIQSLTEQGIRRIRWYSTLGGLVLGLFGALAVLHLLLFVFPPRTIENFLFALFTVLTVAYLVTEMKMDTLSELSRALLYYKLALTLALAMPLSALLLEIQVLRRRIGIAFFVLAGGSALMLLWIWTRPVFGDPLPVIVLCTLIYLETLRLAVVASLRKEPEAWVLALGFASLTAVFLMSILIYLGWIEVPMMEIFVVGVAILALCFSLYLSRRVARKEAERRVLDADNRRKTAELEEARRLQLALLPRELPRLEGVEIAVHMTTANEVGGDYYDFAANGDDLTLAVGDATGHGLTAGMVVAVAKSLFQSVHREPRLSAALDRIGAGLQRMHLRVASMAMLLARLDQRRLRFSSAGMPPVLVWRRDSEDVEEILLPSVPLGTLAGARFDEREIELEPGDAALIMTDGLAEVTGPEGEPVGYDRASRWFGHAARLDAQDAIDELVERAKSFLAGSPLPDDLTLLVLKARA